MSAALWKCPWLSKTCSDSKSRVCKVKNSRDIFTLFSPHSKCPFFKLVRETCWFIGLRASFYPYASNHRPYSVGIVFYMMWRMMNRAQLAVPPPQKKSTPFFFICQTFKLCSNYKHTYSLQEKERHMVNTLTDSNLHPSQWLKHSVKPYDFQSMFTAKWWLSMMPTSLWVVLTSIRDQWQVWYFWRFLELFGYLLAIFEYYFWLCFLAHFDDCK